MMNRLERLNKTSKAWSSCNRAAEYLARETRLQIVEAAYDGYTPEQIRHAVGGSRVWIEEVINQE